MLYSAPIKPMLAIDFSEPFDSVDHLYEIKWDGYRCLAYCYDEVRLFSRNGHNITREFSKIAEDLQLIDKDCVIDGEIVAFDSRGKPNFSLLQSKAGEKSICFIAFDLLYLDREPIMNQPLTLRKQSLNRLINRNPSELTRVGLSRVVERRGISFYQAITDLGLEGMIAKNKFSQYLPGLRSKDWLKIKQRLQLDAVIVGYIPKDFSFSSLVLAQYEQNKLKYIGKVGTGISEIKRKILWEGLNRIKAPCPLSTTPDGLKGVIWVRPLLVAVIDYLEFIDSGLLRQPSFIRLRGDKSPLDCKYEE